MVGIVGAGVTAAFWLHDRIGTFPDGCGLEVIWIVGAGITTAFAVRSTRGRLETTGLEHAVGRGDVSIVCNGCEKVQNKCVYTYVPAMTFGALAQTATRGATLGGIGFAKVKVISLTKAMPRTNRKVHIV